MVKLFSGHVTFTFNNIHYIISLIPEYIAATYIYTEPHADFPRSKRTSDYGRCPRFLCCSARKAKVTFRETSFVCYQTWRGLSSTLSEVPLCSDTSSTAVLIQGQPGKAVNRELWVDTEPRVWLHVTRSRGKVKERETERERERKREKELKEREGDSYIGWWKVSCLDK